MFISNIYCKIKPKTRNNVYFKYLLQYQTKNKKQKCKNKNKNAKTKPKKNKKIKVAKLPLCGTKGTCLLEFGRLILYV